MYLFPWEKPVTIIGGTAQQRQHYVDVTNRVLDTKRGLELLKEITGPWYWHGRPQTIELRPGIRDGTGAIFLRDASGTERSTDRIQIDPSYHPSMQTADGPVTPRDERIVAHELGHSVTGASDSGKDQMDNIKQNENPIVRELGLSPRTQYQAPSIPFKPPVELFNPPW